MGSEKFVTQAGIGVVAGVICKKVAGVEVCVGNGVMVGTLVNVPVSVLVGSEFMGLPIVQAKVKITVPTKKNENFANRIFLISWKICFDNFYYSATSAKYK